MVSTKPKPWVSPGPAQAQRLCFLLRAHPQAHRQEELPPPRGRPFSPSPAISWTQATAEVSEVGTPPLPAAPLLLFKVLFSPFYMRKAPSASSLIPQSPTQLPRSVTSGQVPCCHSKGIETVWFRLKLLFALRSLSHMLMNSQAGEQTQGQKRGGGLL